jgi:GT2 family glycosyltransferase
MKVSLIMLSWNRLDLVKRCCDYSLANAGDKIDQLVWVDNGSTDGTAEYAASLKPDILVLNKENLGMPRGMNQAMALATGEAIASIYSDTIQPDNWLREMKAVLEADPQCDMVMIADKPLEGVRKHSAGRILGPETVVGGRRVVPCVAFETHIYRRSLMQRIGYFREDFPFYGWCDEEWFMRANYHGARSYMLLDMLYKHEGFTGVDQFVAGRGETEEYWKWKSETCRDQKSLALLKWCIANGHPYTNPFA